MASVPSAPSAGAPAPPWRRLAATWRWAKWIVGLGLAGAAIWAATGKSDELRNAGVFLKSVRWEWVLLALVAEALSYVSFASMQRRLLRSGHVAVPLTRMTGISLAFNAIQTTMPAGLVLSVAFSFRQFRRRGADDILAGWVLVAMTVVSFGTLSLVAAVGLAMAFGSGSDFDLVWVIVGITAAVLLVVLAWVRRDLWLPWVGALIRLSQRLTHHPHGDARDLLDHWLARLSAVTPNRRSWAAAAALGLGNWVADLGCLTLSFLAVGAGVPWRGLLLAYGAAQLASNLPITPGGLGVVEGSLTVALVAFGGAEASTVAAVLIYRLLSFWLMLPFGWGSWATLTLLGRRRDRIAQEAATP
ncbi:MAG: UPF0104 family protein [Acidimicrobiaceae bacterium]|nr:UPF0104 family protein [Acidimicrobiaceae bacterium]